MKKILVVDDTKNIRGLLTTCLELRGCEVQTATNGIEAIEKIQHNHFDLVFLDVKMPEVSGTEVLKKIRNLGNTCPIIMMTAYATVKNAVECTRLGAVAYLQKPFTVDKVNEIVDNFFDRASNKSSFEYTLQTAIELLECGKTIDAYNLLRKCLSIDPTNGDIYYYLSVVYEKRKKPEQARKFLQISNLLKDKS